MSFACRKGVESVDGNISAPDGDSAERSTENTSKRNWYHACHTRPRILAVDAEELLEAISIKPKSTNDLQHPKLEGTDET